MERSRPPLVVVPTYNEAENIRALLDAICSLPSHFDILVVDDNSPDGTARLVETHREFPSRVHLLRRERKAGLGTAYRAGFAWALRENYPLICQMDADFSHDPKDLERLVESARSAPLTLGSRYIRGGGTEGWAFRRKFLSRSANVYARWFTGVPAADLTGGFKCYRREALEAARLDDVRSEGYAFQIETTAHVSRAGHELREIPIIFRERRQGLSKISKHIVWEALWVVARLGWNRGTAHSFRRRK